MAPNLGGVACSRVSAEPQIMRETAIEYSVSGIDGHGFQLVGGRGQTFQVRCILYGNRAAVTTWRNALQNLQSTVISFENDFGELSLAHWFTSMTPLLIRPAIGEGDLRAETRVTVRPLVKP